MSWEYSGDPSASTKDAVRFLVGDTDSRDPLLTDGEIDYLLAQYNDAPLNTAIRCCETIMAKFSRMADERVGQVSISFSQKAKGYAALRDELRLRLATEGATPYAGGISVSDKDIQRANADRVKPDFSKQMMDNRAGATVVGGPVNSPFPEESGGDS